MGLVSWIKGVWQKLFRKEIEQKFNADIQLSSVMEGWIEKFYGITSGKPYWIDPENDIESINFAGYIDDVAAGLVALDIGIEIPDTARGKYLQEQADYVLQVIQDKVSEGLGNCGIMFKPNGKNIDYIEPGNFAPTETDSNGNILGCVFQTSLEREKNTYTKLEWHRFEGDVYRITNYAYKARTGSASAQTGIGDPCPLTEVKEWADIAPDVALTNIEKPLFAYFKNPAPNRLDRSSALGVPIWHNALKELKDLDIAWSRKSKEIKKSESHTFVDRSAVRITKRGEVSIPEYIYALEMGPSAVDTTPIHEHVATLLTEQRIADINATLAMISTKCGFSQGFFVLDEKTGRITATQVEADDQQTIDTINNIHEALKDTLLNLFYGLNIMADLYTDTPAEDWNALKDQIVISYHDFTANPDEDRLRALNLTREQFYAKWYYLHKYEGYTEEEAKQRVLEAMEEAKQLQPEDEGLFGEE